MATFNITNYKIINQVSGVALAHYIDTVNTAKADITTGFFNSIADQLGKGSVIICSLKDGVTFLEVTANTAGVVTTSTLI